MVASATRKVDKLVAVPGLAQDSMPVAAVLTSAARAVAACEGWLQRVRLAADPAAVTSRNGGTWMARALCGDAG